MTIFICVLAVLILLAAIWYVTQIVRTKIAYRQYLRIRNK